MRDVRLALTLPEPTVRCEVRVGRGLLAAVPSLLAEHAPAPRYVVISDSNVAPLHGEPLAAALRGSGPPVDLLTFPAGEASKTPETWARLAAELGERGVGRDACVVAVGGGVTGDLAGFVAATYARGVRLVQVPTSLLAMIDASIGGKTGVDLPAGKNLAGAFHQPHLIVVDPAVLATLLRTELRTGLAEAVKHGAIADAEYLDRLTGEATALLDLAPEAIDAVVVGSVRIKAGIVARDPMETGERAVLNFGHTVGHAIERVTAFRVPHGEAVAAGMAVEAALGERLGVTAPGTGDRIRATLAALGLPARPPRDAPPERLIQAMGTDKKARAGTLRFSLLAAIGRAARTPDGEWTVPVERAGLRDVLDEL